MTTEEEIKALVRGKGDFKQKVNQDFLDKAKRLDPQLVKKKLEPVALVSVEKDSLGKVVVKETGKYKDVSQLKLGKGGKVVLDFGNHYVGYVTLDLKHHGSPQDAPAYFRFKFAEIPRELLDDSSTYKGWISRGWIQEEFVHIDYLPQVLSFPRRYAFRYLEVYVIDTSMKFETYIESATLMAESAVDISKVQLAKVPDNLQKIDYVALKTLESCMQSVFEDGPKRDRRLWIGDLRLQALTNYYTFKNNDLVKRCIYLFASMTDQNGRVGACVFTKPNHVVDDSFFFDYSLFFISCVYDYYQATKDLNFVKEMWQTCLNQIDCSVKLFDEKGLLPEELMFGFIDWMEGLNKQAALHGVWIYTLRQALELAKIVKDADKIRLITDLIDKACATVTNVFFDAKQGLFVSGRNKQVNYASQVWLVLAKVLGDDVNAKIMAKVLKNPPEVGMNTPYMNHHYVEALIQVNEKAAAIEHIKKYWGEMVRLGADTFWESFNPSDPLFSPYASVQVNSFCHAWSCTPSYFFRKYFSEGK